MIGDEIGTRLSDDALFESIVGVSTSRIGGSPFGGKRRGERNQMRNLLIGASLIALVGTAFGGASCVNNEPGLKLVGIPSVEGSAETTNPSCEVPTGEPVTEQVPVSCSSDSDCDGGATCNMDGQCEGSEGVVVEEQTVDCSGGCPQGSGCGSDDLCRGIEEPSLSVPGGYTCTVPEAGGVSAYENEVRINLPGIKNAGRVGEPGGVLPSESDICQTYEESGYSERTTRQFVVNSLRGKGYTVWLEVLNELLPSESVGVQGQGGGSGGYEGLQLDANTIELRKLRVSFPNASGSGLGKEIDVAGIAESGGEGIVKGVQVFDSRDFSALTELHSQLPGDTSQDNDVKTTRMKLRFTGRTIGGTDVESTALEVPLHLCTKGDPCFTPPTCDFESGG